MAQTSPAKDSEEATIPLIDNQKEYRCFIQGRLDGTLDVCMVVEVVQVNREMLTYKGTFRCAASDPIRASLACYFPSLINHSVQDQH